MKLFAFTVIVILSLCSNLVAKKNVNYVSNQEKIEKIIQLQLELEQLSIQLNKKVIELRKLTKKTKKLEKQFIGIEKENLKEYTY